MKCMIAITRFNATTWEENHSWRKKNNWIGAAYGSPVRASSSITENIPLFVLEMHNTENKIKGIGLIRNVPLAKGHYKIYSDGNYNRYTYSSKYRIDRTSLIKKEEAIIHILDVLLFTGSRHLKRGQGINALPLWIVNTKHINFLAFFREMFKHRYKDINSQPISK